MRRDPDTTIGPLFGEIALDLRLLRAADVLDALCEQQEQRGRGERPDRIGQILVDRGKLSREQVGKIMTEVERRARTLQIPGYHSIELVSRDETTLRFRGVALGSRRPVMIKVLRFSLADNPDELTRFQRECDGLARLNHVNVVRLLDSGDLEGVPYLVLEHVQGPDLGSHIEDAGAIEPIRALEILAAVSEGLHHAHSLAILHASLRPEAILLPRLGGPKVTDFTLFEWVPGDTAAPGLHGRSPHYLSPEQASGTGWPTVRSDIYSLGATFFHMLTGRPPFRGSYQEILRKHQRRIAPDPRVHVAGIPARVANFVSRLLEKDPEERPEDMREVATEAVRLAESTPVTRPGDAGEEGPGEPSRLRSRRSGR